MVIETLMAVAPKRFGSRYISFKQLMVIETWTRLGG